ncbi:MAG: hypothetical protein K0S27_1382 [Gammaproteobacteria bacterium]|nr:hypothetical protein [Gammaproteobacteria bacterium]
MSNENITHTNECQCLAWKPIFAGALVATGLAFLLNLFSTAIGLTAFTINSEGAESIVLGGLLGAGVAMVVSLFAAGWLTGYLGQRHCNKRHLGALYGFLAWCLALIFAIFLASHAQEYLSFYGHFLSGTTDIIQANPVTSSSHLAVAVSDVSAKKLVISTYIIFSLFFLGAFACSLGGHCGMRYVCKKDVSCKTY